MRWMLVVSLVLFGSGCGGDAPSCEDALRGLAKRMPADDRPSDDDIAKTITMCKEAKWSPEIRTCVGKASSDVSAMECLSKARKAERGGRKSKGKLSEAELNLKAIEKSAKTEYIVEAQFPKGSAPLTPATSCCDGGNQGKCKTNPANWHGVEIWDRLDFEVVEDHYFRYSYEGDGETFVARAVGDLDCDGTEVTYELRGMAVGGEPTFTLTEPDRPD
jgi:hypothetical protein